MKTVSLVFLICLTTQPFLMAQDYYAQGDFTLSSGEGGHIEKVSSALDGDTLRLSNGQNLKLAGINTPEIHNASILPQEAKQFGMEVWAYRTIGGDAHKEVQRLLVRSQNLIRLESDGEAFDEEGNLRAYVFIPVERLEEGMVPDEKVILTRGESYEIFLNAYLVKLGFAEIRDDDANNSHQALLSKMEEEAKKNKLRLWKDR